jgi:hypothetical protein
MCEKFGAVAGLPHPPNPEVQYTYVFSVFLLTQNNGHAKKVNSGQRSYAG